MLMCLANLLTHNLKVVGSNPTPATKMNYADQVSRRFFYLTHSCITKLPI